MVDIAHFPVFEEDASLENNEATGEDRSGDS